MAQGEENEEMVQRQNAIDAMTPQQLLEKMKKEFPEISPANSSWLLRQQLAHCIAGELESANEVLNNCQNVPLAKSTRDAFLAYEASEN